MARTYNYQGHISRGGRSSVYKYMTMPTSITIYFKDKAGKEATYIYYKNQIGAEHNREMKILAGRGKGLNTYIHHNKIKGIRQIQQ